MIDILTIFQEAFKKSQENFDTSSDQSYWIVSKEWLETWIDSEKKQQQMDSFSLVNDDIVLHKPNTIFKYDPINSHMWNKILKPNLQEKVDYEIVDLTCWEIIRKNFRTIPIERDVTIINGRKQVNVNLIPLNFGAVFPSSLSKFVNGRNTTLIKGDQYVTLTCKLGDFIALLSSTLQTVTGYNFLKQDGIRLYKAPIGMKFSEIESHITEELKQHQQYNEIQFDFKDAEYLDPLKFETIEDCDIVPEQIILGDFKEMSKNWAIKHPNFPSEGKCESCYQYKVLQFPCECKKVSYCSEECKKRDEAYHLQRCEKTDSDEETMNKLIRNEKSIDGKVGLKNLGNTCFMNSGIQCLSNTYQLREYLLTNEYKEDINEQNTLGTKGELATKFAHLIRKMWYGDKQQIPPFSFKRAIGKFQPQFQGYQQHDSQELITYLLDGLNEDLNRIKQKPYIERKDYDGRPDFEVARESWEQFKQRNDSVIVDNLYGLYKSTLKCPNCQKISITFDPYLMVNVSIPQNAIKQIEVTFINSEQIWDCQNYNLSYDKKIDPTLGTLLEEQLKPDIINAPVDQYIYICTSTYQHDDTNNLEKISTLKKKLKYKKLYIRKAFQSELSIPQDEKVCIMIHESFKQHANYAWKREITPAFNFYFNKKTTTHYDIHKFIFELHVGILKTFQDIPTYEGEFENYYTNNILEKVYELEFKSNQNWQVSCAYCDAKQCNDCLCKFDKEDTISKYLDKEPKLEMEIHIVWKRGFKADSSVEEVYNDWIKHHQKEQTPINDEQKAQEQCLAIEPAKEQQKNSSSKSFTLGECLKYSEQPEQLDEQNTWYCSQCKDHVRAYKVMEIYKVPKILIFHLKRFKNSNKFFKSKLETNVEFPIDDFDIREFVQNHNLPSDFEKENPNTPESTVPLNYELYAISNHFGGIGGGHYTAYAKNYYDNQWYDFDDSTVHRIQQENVQSTIVTNKAYVLFYRKKE